MDLKKIEQLYSENIEKYGIDSRSVGWNSPGSQEMRFSKLMSVVEDKTKSFTLNELGCGYGELYKFCETNAYNLTLFNGYDISEKMLDAAKTYLSGTNSVFYNSPKIITCADYTITSGIFNVKFDTEANSWEDYIKETITNMFENSKKGISFNLLTKYVDFEAKDLYYADPCYFFEFCKKSLSRSVNLLHDYQLFEWTIVVRK